MASIKSDKARRYWRSAEEQLPSDVVPTEKDVCVEMVIYYSTRRPDLDESLILDILQGYIYKNDRQVKQKKIYWQLDRVNPRAIIRVTELEELTFPDYLNI